MSFALAEFESVSQSGSSSAKQRGVDNTAAGSPETSKRQGKPSIIKALIVMFLNTL
jgi:hypothetical protein